MKYILVKWPESQEVMEYPRFKDCSLADEEKFGSSAYFVPEEIVEAAKVLKQIVKGTVIDPDWFDYLIEEKGKKNLKALLTFSGCNSYRELLKNYEGATVEGLMLNDINQEQNARK